MYKKILLEGEPCSGKSTLLLNLLKEQLKFAVGYRTVRVKGSDDRVRAYAHIRPDSDFCTDVLSDSPLENEFLTARYEESGKKREFHPEVFEKFTIPEMLRKDGKFVYVDEIGGSELNIPSVFNAYVELFKSDRPVIGVLKCPGNASHFAFDSYLKLKGILEDSDDVCIFEYSSVKKDEAAELIKQWKEDNL